MPLDDGHLCPQFVDNIAKGLGAIVVDMQTYFLTDLDPNIARSTIDAQVQTLRALADYDIPVVMLEFIGYGATASEVKDAAHLSRRTELISKRSDDGFYGTYLRSMLKEDMNVERVLLMGINASYCVRATAESALMHGYPVYTAGDIIANSIKHQNKLGMTIEWFKGIKGAYFDSHAEIVELLRRQKMQPQRGMQAQAA